MACTDYWHFRVDPEFSELVKAHAASQKKSLTRYVLDLVRQDMNPVPEEPAVITPLRVLKFPAEDPVPARPKKVFEIDPEFPPRGFDEDGDTVW